MEAEGGQGGQGTQGEAHDPHAAAVQWARTLRIENMELRSRLAGAEQWFIAGARSDEERRKRLAYLLTAPSAQGILGAGSKVREGLFPVAKVLESRRRLERGFAEPSGGLLNAATWDAVAQHVCGGAEAFRGRLAGAEAQRLALLDAVTLEGDKLEALAAALDEEVGFVERRRMQEVNRLTEELLHVEENLDRLSYQLGKMQALPEGVYKLRSTLPLLRFTPSGLVREVFNRWRLLRKPLWLRAAGQALTQDSATHLGKHNTAVRGRRDKRKAGSPSPVRKTDAMTSGTAGVAVAALLEGAE